MADPTPTNLETQAAQMFPILTPAQQARIAAHGRVRQVPAGEALVEADDHGKKFFVVIKDAELEGTQ